jgi:hypothetical protein
VEQSFSDGIGAISIVGSTVRLDFVIISPAEKEPNGQPKVVLQQRVVMTLEGFTNSAEKIRNALQALEKIKSRAGGDENSATPQAHEQTAASPRAKPPFP